MSGHQHKPIGRAYRDGDGVDYCDCGKVFDDGQWRTWEHGGSADLASVYPHLVPNDLLATLESVTRERDEAWAYAATRAQQDSYRITLVRLHGLLVDHYSGILPDEIDDGPKIERCLRDIVTERDALREGLAERDSYRTEFEKVAAALEIAVEKLKRCEEQLDQARRALTVLKDHGLRLEYAGISLSDHDNRVREIASVGLGLKPWSVDVDGDGDK